jgi:hypothetical protein
MLGNVPIPEIPENEDAWLTLLITSVRERTTQAGRPYLDAFASNATGTIGLKIWADAVTNQPPLKPGLWRVTGKLETFLDRLQFVVTEYQSITIAEYREDQAADPHLPRAFTLDIETLTLPDFRERVGAQLERQLRLGNMRLEQQQRYLEDIAAEEERCYSLGSLSATSGRILSIALHVGPVPDRQISGVQQPQSEHVFGIDSDGFEEDEKKALINFIAFMKSFDANFDELVGHNILGFDLPFIFQRCLVHGLKVSQFVNLAEYNVRGVFDTMHRWWLGARRTVSLDDLAWALGIESSKTSEVEGSKVFDLYQAGKLEVIREYNLNDVRVTRKIYERMISSLGR